MVRIKKGICLLNNNSIRRKEEIMKRHMLVLVILLILVLALAGVAQAGQGRMGGMNDPYGLVQDESDFLIHPAKIAKGEGVRFYGYYLFTYTDVMEWDSDIEYYDAGGLDFWDNFDLSGDEYGHNALVGAAFPLGPGRMGLFFTYAGKRGDYSGSWIWADDYSLDFASGLDDFALRLLYGLPVGGINLGAEVQAAYRHEKQEYSEISWWGEEYFNPSFYWWNWDDFWVPSHLPIGFFPHESSYWDVLLKGSAEFALGPADVEFVLRGGLIVPGDNEWVSEVYDYGPPDTLDWYEDMDGDVEGWQIGGDLWVRYPLGGGVALPFLVRIDYQEKTRDGDVATWNPPTDPYPGEWSSNHKIREKSLELEAGGGLDMEIGAGTRIAGGIYYNYLQRQENRSYNGTQMPVYPYYYNTDFQNPDLTEHQVLVRFAGEHEFSPLFTLRGGLNAFYGWVTLNSSYNYFSNDLALPWGWLWWQDSTATGSHWGIGGSVGGTISLNGFALEPFVKGGYQHLDLDGDGDAIYAHSTYGSGYWLTEEELTRSAWYISGGCSFLFDL
jgi:hypothetical protein